MRSVLHNLLAVAIALALFVAASRLLRRAPTDGYIEAERVVVVAPDANLKGSVLDAATIERLRQWRSKPKKVYVVPIQVVPPPRNHESTRWVKSVS